MPARAPRPAAPIRSQQRPAGAWHHCRVREPWGHMTPIVGAAARAATISRAGRSTLAAAPRHIVSQMAHDVDLDALDRRGWRAAEFAIWQRGRPIPSEETVHVAYEFARRALDRNMAVLSELRTRAGLVLTATGVVASLLGGQVLGDPHPLGLVLSASTSLLGGIICCLLVLAPVRDEGVPTDHATEKRVVRPSGAPTREWRSTLTARDLQWLATSHPGEPVLPRVVVWMDGSRAGNRQTLNKRTRLLTAACLLLIIGIGLWGGAILAGARGVRSNQVTVTVRSLGH
jgi:hypothetical protein